MSLQLINNQSVLFGLNEDSGAALLQGWSDPEVGQVWTSGLSAVLRFALPRLSHGSVVVLQASPHLTDDLSAQRVVVYGNGLYVGSWHLRSDGQIAIPLPSFVGMSVLVSGLLDLAFELPDCCSGSGEDRRLLAFALHGLLLRAG